MDYNFVHSIRTNISLLLASLFICRQSHCNLQATIPKLTIVHWISDNCIFYSQNVLKHRPSISNYYQQQSAGGKSLANAILYSIATFIPLLGRIQKSQIEAFETDTVCNWTTVWSMMIICKQSITYKKTQTQNRYGTKSYKKTYNSHTLHTKTKW